MNSPVVVTGTSRSGKSLVCDILNESGEFELFREPRTLWSTGRTGRGHDRLRSEDVDQPSVLKIRRRCVRLPEGIRYLDNLSYHALHIPLVRAVFPDVRLVHMVRHYREAIPEIMRFWKVRPPIWKTLRVHTRNLQFRSLIRLGCQFAANYFDVVRGRPRRTCGPRVPGMEEVAGRESLAGVVAWQWAQLVRIAREELARMPPEQWIEIRYEDLLRDPSATLDRLSRHIGIRHSARIVRAGRAQILPAGVVSEREELTPDDWITVDRVIEEVLGADFLESSMRVTGGRDG